MEDITIPPKASSLIESLRDIGYSLKAAIADIIDNSISASASRIELFFKWDNKAPHIAIIDDGTAMSFDELIEAMRPGSTNPLADRNRKDLGRFGLGLKTASFSQCRKLTVVSRKDGRLSGCCWDLDYVAEKDEWLLKVLKDDQIKTLPEFSRLGDSGTIVLWENLDRVIDRTDSASTEVNLYEKMDTARKHQELVFHRYLKGESGIKPISIFINGDPLKPFDPFNLKNPATQHLQDEKLEIYGKTIYIQPYILPHHSKTSLDDYEYYAGEGGYLTNQGFYVYRNSRLIIYGTWFRLAGHRELTKLARVRIDLPNSLDYLWAIDVRKSRANPPAVIRRRLKNVIEQITGKSKRVYTTRGRLLTQDGVNTVWLRKIMHNKINYSINRNHPIIDRYVSGLNEPEHRFFNDILSLIEGQFPVDAFFSDVSGSPESLSQNMVAEEKLFQLAELFYEGMEKQGLAPDKIKEHFERTEPFRNNYERIAHFLKSKGIKDE
jgi:hypothetical protein